MTEPTSRDPESEEAVLKASQILMTSGERVRQPHRFRAASWRHILLRLWKAIGDDQLTLIAAALAFYGLLSFFPALTALVALYGLAFDPQDIWEQSEKLSVVLPDDVHGLIFSQLSDLVQQDGTGLGLGLFLSLALLMWSASTGMQSLMRSINLAYNETETRPYWKIRGIAIILTLTFILFVAISISLIAVVPQVLSFWGLAQTGQWMVSVLRWPLLALGVIVVLSVLYRFGPNRAEARWRWVSWGACLATVLWLAGSWIFAWYSANFGAYHETYGALGAVVVLLLWMYLSSFVILLGAEVNASLELQTLADSTVGPDDPIGERGAHVADTPPDP